MTSNEKDGDELLGPRELIVEIPIEKATASIPRDAGYPWSVGQFDYVESDATRGRQFLPEPGTKSWLVEYTLSNTIDLTHERVSLDQAAMGCSHLRLQQDTDLRTSNASGEGFTFQLLRAPDGTLGKITVPVTADHPMKARMIAGQAVTGLLGALSFAGNVPLYVRQEIVRDPKSGWARFWIVLAAPPPTLGRVEIRVPQQLRPVYALWRESRNAHSYFYKFLCLFKIVEGLLQNVLPSVHRDLASAGKPFEPFRGIVPADRDIEAATPEFVGKKFSRVRDDLRGEYRNALAHFGLDGKPPLDIDDQTARREYERLFPVVDHLARTLITEAERLLAL